LCNKDLASKTGFLTVIDVSRCWLPIANSRVSSETFNYVARPSVNQYTGRSNADIVLGLLT